MAEIRTLFMDGEFLPVERGFISVDTHSFSMGTGCLEGIRGYWNDEEQQMYLFRLHEHYERLLESCKILYIELPYTVEDLSEITKDLIRKNALREDVYVRIIAYKSEKKLNIRLHGLPSGIVISVMPMGNFVNIDGLRCAVSSWKRIDDNSIPARAKICGSYVNSALAKSEVLQNGFDEAILLNNDGHVAEGSAENIFLVKDNEFITPSPTENILLGITRATVMELGKKEMGYSVRERPMDRTELYIADEIFLCGTGAQIAPVINVDHRPVGNEQVGPVVRKLQEIYFQTVRGQHREYRERWCSPVYL